MPRKRKSNNQGGSATGTGGEQKENIGGYNIKISLVYCTHFRNTGWNLFQIA